MAVVRDGLVILRGFQDSSRNSVIEEAFGKRLTGSELLAAVRKVGAPHIFGPSESAPTTPGPTAGKGPKPSVGGME